MQLRLMYVLKMFGSTPTSTPITQKWLYSADGISLPYNAPDKPKRLFTKTGPSNLQLQKERFLVHGISPTLLCMRRPGNTTTEKLAQKRAEIRTEFLSEATAVIGMVNAKYGDATDYLNVAFGQKIDRQTAHEIMLAIIKENCVEGQLKLNWTPDLPCSAQMKWKGPCQRYNRPEARKYTFLINSSSHNVFLREIGVRCLADHEIGTHFFRTVNDGLQPWFSDRKRFNLRSTKDRDSVSTEEGLAAVNTILNSNSNLLWNAAIAYYTSCKATEMSFGALFDHLSQFVSDRELRWKLTMRAKRGLPDSSIPGGCGNDQCYFEGAVQVLRHAEYIDFNLLYSGKVCIDELQRVQRIARLNSIRMPAFTSCNYQRRLTQIAVANGLVPRCTLPKSITTKTVRRNTKRGRRSQKTQMIQIDELSSFLPEESAHTSIDDERLAMALSDTHSNHRHLLHKRTHKHKFAFSALGYLNVDRSFGSLCRVDFGSKLIGESFIKTRLKNRVYPLS